MPISWLECTDAAPAGGVPQGNSLGRCEGAADHNRSSAEDWFRTVPTPGEPNIPSYPSDCWTAIDSELNWGALKALYRPATGSRR